MASVLTQPHNTDSGNGASPRSIAAASTLAAAQSRANAVAAHTQPDRQLVAAKQALRSSMDHTLSSFTPSQLASQSALLLARLTAHPTWIRARAIALFVSMPKGELQTMDIIRRALEQGKRVFVPRIEAAKKQTATVAASAGVSDSVAPPPVPALAPSGGRMRLLEISSFAELESFVPNRWGIREPPLTVGDAAAAVPRNEAHDCEELELVVCPGVAFDPQRRRLGHGKGYYDTYLASLQLHRASHSLPPVATIAVGFDEQIIEEVPVGVLDLPLDEVITPTKHFPRNNETKQA